MKLARFDNPDHPQNREGRISSPGGSSGVSAPLLPQMSHTWNRPLGARDSGEHVMRNIQMATHAILAALLTIALACSGCGRAGVSSGAKPHVADTDEVVDLSIKTLEFGRAPDGVAEGAEIEKNQAKALKTLKAKGPAAKAA